MHRLFVLMVTALVAAIAGTGTPATGQTTASGSAVSPPEITKLLVVVEENHSLAQMKSGMPYTFGLAQRYGYASNYHALRHPSLPNYIAITGGQMYGITDDAGPSSHQITGRSVFGQARHYGKTAATYAEDMPRACATSNSGRYVVKHNPWAYFVNNRVGCKAKDRSMASFAPDVKYGRLPRVGMVVPNLCHDAHDCSLGTADAYFKTLMTTVFAGSDWKSGHLAVVLTADEDDRNAGNVVLTTVIHPSQSHHVVTTRLDHYSLTRLYDEVADLPYLHNAASATSMTRAFNLPVC